MKTYCDTNILTAFVNQDELIEKFGGSTANSYFRVKGRRSPNATNQLKNLDKCIIDKKFLARDLNGHNASMGATLTSLGLKDIQLVDFNGLEEGRKIFSRACGKVSTESGFYKKFCENRQIKSDKNLKRNINDVGHFGSASLAGATHFLTDNQKDFKSLKLVTKMEVI